MGINTQQLIFALKSISYKLCPIKRHELSRFLPLFFMKFFASFVYTILNATKDTIIVTNKGSGAEVIPILKGGVVISVAFIFMLTYSKLSNKFSRENVFYLVLLPFLAFFICYGFFLYPNQYELAFNKSADIFSNLVGSQHSHWVAAYRYWMNSIFFVVSEMWGGVMISLLFWGFANQINTIADAARFYTLYTVGGHVGTIFAGTIIMQYAGIGNSNFHNTVMQLMTIASVGGGIIMFLFWWTNRYVLHIKWGLNTGNAENSGLHAASDGNNNKTNNNKTKLSLRQSLLFIAKSPYLGCIALLVIGYGISVNMVEVVWKAALKIQYPNPAEYQAFMGVLQTLIGAVSLIVALFVGGTVIRKFGWERGAILTPIVLGVTTVAFFSLYFVFPPTLAANLSKNVSVFGLTITPLLLLVLCGSFHNISSKAMKYCLFDPTKEMAYIPLDQESKVKGKAAVDLVGARFGKSASSWIQLGLIDFFSSVGSILDVVYLLVPLVFTVIFFWISAVKKLGKKFRVKNSGLQHESAEDLAANAVYI